MNLIPSNAALDANPQQQWVSSADTAFPATQAHTQDETIAAILSVFRAGERFLVCSHSWPDGDAIGSMIAIGMLLEQMGKHVDMVTADRVPANCQALPGVEAIRSESRIRGFYDAAILLECDSLARARLDGLEEFFLINIDHHASGRQFADLNWIDPDATSVGELVYWLVKAAGAVVTPEMATCLYATVLTDTAGFCFGSIQASTFAMARDLTLAGAEPIRIAQDVCFSTSTSKMLLLGAALGNLKREGPVVWLWVTNDDMVRIGAFEEDCEGIVNFAVCISDVEAAVFLRELPEGRIRISLRSKGKVNVASIAQELGGGGHDNLAGCTVEGPLNRAIEEVLAELRLSLAYFTKEKLA
jgi:phosphoesterase RecJ-like protein